MAHNITIYSLFLRISSVIEQKYVAAEQYFVINQLWESDEWKEAFERMFEQHDLCDIVMEEFEAKVKMEAGGNSTCLFFANMIEQILTTVVCCTQCCNYGNHFHAKIT